MPDPRLCLNLKQTQRMIVTACPEVHTIDDHTDTTANDSIDRNPTATNPQRLISILNQYNDSLQVLSVLSDFATINEQYDASQFMNGRCERKNCVAYRRKNIQVSDTDNALTEAVHHIMDKMHWYYCHPMINKSVKQSSPFMHQRLKSINKDEEKKQNDISSSNPPIAAFVMSRRNRKYNSLTVEQAHTEGETASKVYCFGHLFEYGYPGEQIFHSSRITIKRKYICLKQELTENPIFRMAMRQYDIEYDKAMMHYRTEYRKRRFIDLNFGCLFAIMIYCNYDGLQHEFSKTYYENTNGHHNFYHLGMFIKIAVQSHGTSIEEGSCKHFYHGISEKLSFTELFGKIGYGLFIFSPLSTSRSFSAAANFASADGLIVDFQDGNMNYIRSAKYFDTSWVSDFPFEKECLFIQNRALLQVNDIRDPLTGFECKLILSALQAINKIIMNQIPEIQDQTRVLSAARTIVHHYWSEICIKYQKHKELQENQYVKKMIDSYFASKKEVSLKCDIASDKMIILGVFGDALDPYLDLSFFTLTFPNIRRFSAANPVITEDSLASIIEELRDGKLIEVILSDLSKESAMLIQHYQDTFKELAYTCSAQELRNRIDCKICQQSHSNNNLMKDDESTPPPPVKRILPVTTTVHLDVGPPQMPDI